MSDTSTGEENKGTSTINEVNISGSSNNNLIASSTGFVNDGQLTAVNVSVAGTSNVYNNYTQPHKKDKLLPLHVYTTPCREFTGRDKELKMIKESLSAWHEDRKREDSVDRTFVIQGLGGIGKSNLAFKFAQLNRDTYDCIFQIGAQTKEAMVAGFQKFAQSLKLELRDKQNDITGYDVERLYRRAAEVYQRVLIIFDNAERLHKASDTSETFGIFDYLANKPFIRNKPVFLVTTRNGGEAWEANGESMDSVPSSQRLPIDFLSEEEAYICLLGQFRMEDQKSEIGPELEERIRQLATLLGGYPLSMSLIAAIIARKVRKEAFGEDLKTQAKYYIDLLSPHKIQEHEGDRNHKAKLSLIFKETLKQIRLEEDGDMAEQLLGMIAYLQPHASYAGFLNGVVTKTEFVDWDPYHPVIKCEELSSAVKRGLKVLQAYSIISVHEERKINDYFDIELVHDMIKVHRLVQAQVQTELVPRHLNTVKSFVDYIDVTGSSDLDFDFRYFEALDVLLHQLEPKNVARQILVVLCHLMQSDCYDKIKILFLNKLQAVSEHLNEDEKLMLELGELYVKYKTKKDSSSDCQQDSDRILKQLPKLGKEFFKKPWVLRACCRTMSIVYDHHRRWRNRLESEELGRKCRTSFANWLYDQIIYFNETTTSGPWFQNGVLDIFCSHGQVHIENSKFINVVKVLAPQVKNYSDLSLLDKCVLKFAKDYPWLSCTDKTELMSAVSEIFPVTDKEKNLQKNVPWRKGRWGESFYMRQISGFLNDLLSRDSFVVAASSCERFISRYEIIMQKLLVNDEKMLFTRLLEFWFALWAHREASKKNVAHINEFISTLPDVLDSSFLEYFLYYPCKNKQEKSDFIKKFKGAPNLNSKVIEVAERLRKYGHEDNSSTPNQSHRTPVYSETSQGTSAPLCQFGQHIHF